MSLCVIFCGKRRNVEKQWREHRQQHLGWRDVGFLSLLWIMFLFRALGVEITKTSRDRRVLGTDTAGTIICSQWHCRRGFTDPGPVPAPLHSVHHVHCPPCRRPSVESVADTRIVTPSIQQYVNLKYELGCIVDMETETDITWVHPWAFLGRGPSCHSYCSFVCVHTFE